MSTQILQFPPGFIWGAATASHQNEGNNSNNDFWEWEKIPGHVIDSTNSGQAVNWWQMQYFAQDIATMSSLHLNTLRLSLEWSRIEPKPNVWDEMSIAHYQAMLQELQQRGIRPMITLHHFTNPIWITEQGGWTNPKTVEYFLGYVEKVVLALQTFCTLWCTINEPNVYATMCYVLGKWPPGHHSLCEMVKVMRNFVSAHAQAYHLIHKIQPQAEVGLAQHFAGISAKNPRSILSRLVAKQRSQLLNWSFLSAVLQGKMRFPCCFWPYTNLQFANTNDYIGVNYYGRHLLKFSLLSPGTLFGKSVHADPKSAWPQPWEDREISPESLFEFLLQLRQYNKPIYITENGMADSDDSIRPAFILTHLVAIHRAIQQGADVRGFYYWTLVDNYEWTEGWTTRFGLVALNPQTQERTLRLSAKLLSEIAQNNAITPDLVAKYAPQITPQIFL